MSDYDSCPNCDWEASGALGGGVYIELHKCNVGGHVFCDNCKDDDACPDCGSEDVEWNFDRAFTEKSW